MTEKKLWVSKQNIIYENFSKICRFFDFFVHHFYHKFLNKKDKNSFIYTVFHAESDGDT